MEKYIDTKASMHQMKLVMMGAKVEQINSKLCYVNFTLNNCEVAYVYNINSKNRFFLERIKPYPLTYMDYEHEEDVIKEIENDINQFRNADLLYKNISQFITINNEINFITREFEDLFLYYNVSIDNLRSILNKIIDINNQMKNSKN